MKVTVNGEARDLREGTTILDIVRDLDTGSRLGVAVAVNGEVVAKSEWDGSTLEDGDRIEVLRAIGGG